MILANFTAELHCQHGQVGIADTSFSDNPITSADEDGWLCTRNKRSDKDGFKAVAFEFVFREQTRDRIHYTINCANEWDYKGAKLERNSNGWLGLYGTHVAGRFIEALNPANLLGRQDFWKIAIPQEWDGDVNSAETIEFHLRDRHGHRVSQARSSFDGLSHGWYLNAGDKQGELLTFTLRNIVLA